MHYKSLIEFSSYFLTTALIKLLQGYSQTINCEIETKKYEGSRSSQNKHWKGSNFNE